MGGGWTTSSSPGSYKYLYTFQSGFRSGDGTETALVGLLDNMHWQMERRNETMLILMHFSAAFDATDHDILLDCLSSLGLGGTIL